ncbi:polysaccharide deacetylase family protein [Chlorogloeopsis sp. ULAP02]|jgi:peptidoglycan-N-acetylglucosamine deacetylase|uniref:polysaccharide deacetylase family protein n=1 Tax=Chlorogloeopsis sp. ULAP02 TaxID=3107926 RepID=UPI00398B5C84
MQLLYLLHSLTAEDEIRMKLKVSPQIAKLEVADGHAIGNHTWYHWYRHMNLSVAAREIESTATAIYQIMGVKTFLFRPPYGILNNGVADYAQKNNYAVLMWSDDSINYRRPPVSKTCQ